MPSNHVHGIKALIIQLLTSNRLMVFIRPPLNYLHRREATVFCNIMTLYHGVLSLYTSTVRKDKKKKFRAIYNNFLSFFVFYVIKDYAMLTLRVRHHNTATFIYTHEDNIFVYLILLWCTIRATYSMSFI